MIKPAQIHNGWSPSMYFGFKLMITSGITPNTHDKISQMQRLKMKLFVDNSLFDSVVVKIIKAEFNNSAEREMSDKNVE